MREFDWFRNYEKMRRRAIIRICCILFLNQLLFSSEYPTALFLVDAQQNLRLYSMGNIFSSVSPNDAFNNPWALGWTVNSGVSFYQWSGAVEDSRYNYVGVVAPYTRRGAFNLSYLTYSTGEETVEELDGTVRTIKFEENTLLSIGYGFNLGQKFFLGGNAKYLSSTLASTYKANAFLADIGLAYHTLSDKHILGACVRNLGQDIKYYKTKEPSPTEVKLGYSYKFKPAPKHKILCGLSYADVINGNTQTMSAGVEYFPGLSIFSIRGGVIKRDEDVSYTSGIGVSLSGFNCDVGYEMMS
ncbi:MAG: PorV/PorQ family protein, partial [bacterium]